MEPDEIRRELAGWKLGVERRDMLVKLAHGAGLPIREISQLSGISRTTIYKILDMQEGGE